MRVDWLIAGSNSVRPFNEQLRRIVRLPEAPAQLARLHQLKWGVHGRYCGGRRMAGFWSLLP